MTLKFSIFYPLPGLPPRGKVSKNTHHFPSGETGKGVKPFKKLPSILIYLYEYY